MAPNRPNPLPGREMGKAGVQQSISLPAPGRQAPGRGSASRRQPQSQSRRGLDKGVPPVSEWQLYRSLMICLERVPEDATTWDIWSAFQKYGNIVFIDILQDRRDKRNGMGRVRFEPPPKENFWTDNAAWIAIQGKPHVVDVKIQPPESMDAACITPLRNRVPSCIYLHPTKMVFGIPVAPSALIEKTAISSSKSSGNVQLKVDFMRRKIIVIFRVYHKDRRSTLEYRMDVPFSRLGKLYRIRREDNNWALVISLDSPPKFYRRLHEERSHSKEKLRWTEMDIWTRSVGIEKSLVAVKEAELTLDNDLYIIELGRWTTYWFDMKEDASQSWAAVENALHDYNIYTKNSTPIQLSPDPGHDTWHLLNPTDHSSEVPSKEVSALEMLGAFGEAHFADQLDIPYEVRYQLEVCISHGIFNEYTITREFLVKLLAMSSSLDPDRPRLMLEYAADQKKRIFDPMTLLRDSAAKQYFPTTLHIPDYCALVRKITVTPTHVYFNSPVVETTNRVIRHFHDLQRNFVRVQFTDELTEGRINSSDADRDNAIFSRVFRVLQQGIRIGKFHFKFLAFGNSQLRENSAFFFCPPEGQPDHVMTCEKIRAWMGNFAHIDVVAKYAARLGQCFSTTRLLRVLKAPVLRPIEDVERDGYCFTDGIGKISPLVAQLIAHDWKLNDPPSAVQFRMGGCKGVLAVWPDVKNMDVHIRKSQEKFVAEFKGLEIIRCAHYSVATLSRQIITILSCLGVPDSIFQDMLRSQLAAYNKALEDKATAIQLLTKCIDENQMTITIAQMVADGFLDSKEPFLLTLLHLWRSWSIKALKEKARIIVDQGAFVLGCVDETGTLRGYESRSEYGVPRTERKYPQIFLQVPDVTQRNEYKVIKGLCLVGRNPSLHPGDIRLVEAVDIPELHHLRDVVVFPLKGERDVPGMLSGGDLDGDDFFVIWDPKLLPKQNYAPSNFRSGIPRVEDHEPNVSDLTAFFVLYMKHNSLPLIAHAHLAQADWSEQGAKDKKCVQLAELHSIAVDYVKTGEPAIFPKSLNPRNWPHFMEKARRSTYHSRSALGKLYDMIQRVEFRPSYEMPFDQRIFRRYVLNSEILKAARKLKSQYDTSMRRIMGQMEVETEFEVWTTFCLSKPRVGTDYKLQEKLGRESAALKAQYREACIEIAGSRDLDKLGPFVAAMYRVTAEEVRIALHEVHHGYVTSDGVQRKRRINKRSMPLISFPWLFESVLGQIANGTSSQKRIEELARVKQGKHKSRPSANIEAAVDEMNLADAEEDDMEMDYARREDGRIFHRGEILYLFDHDEDDDGWDSDGEMDYSDPADPDPEGIWDVVDDAVSSSNLDDMSVTEVDEQPSDLPASRDGKESSAQEVHDGEAQQRKTGSRDDNEVHAGISGKDDEKAVNTPPSVELRGSETSPDGGASGFTTEIDEANDEAKPNSATVEPVDDNLIDLSTPKKPVIKPEENTSTFQRDYSDDPNSDHPIATPGKTTPSQEFNKRIQTLSGTASQHGSTPASQHHLVWDERDVAANQLHMYAPLGQQAVEGVVSRPEKESHVRDSSDAGSDASLEEEVEITLSDEDEDDEEETALERMARLVARAT